MNKAKKVFVGMSGGVDSTAAALLLKQQGLEPIGITLQMWGEEDKNSKDAAQVCQILNIEHRTIDLRERFMQKVVKPFADEYTLGVTPNPCVCCNRHIKFAALWEEAEKLGAGIATGHYARILHTQNGVFLAKGADANKEQSYVLWNLPRHLLEWIYLPLGDKTKPEIRELAIRSGVFPAQKADSQDICFIPDGDYAAFLERLHPNKNPSGNFIDEDGTPLGRHRGIWHYTVGQRKGLGISFGKPMFVKQICSNSGDIILSESNSLYSSSLHAASLNWLDRDKLEQPEKFQVKLRYSSKPADALVTPTKTGVQVELKNPQRAITPGQSIVFYREDILCGGAVIQP